VSTGLIVASAKAMCGDEELDNGCNVATLNGFYVFTTDGFNVTTNTKFTQSGYEIYRGNGTMSGFFTGSDNGVISRNIRYTGTYTLNPDCSGTLTTRDEGSNVDLHFDQFVMPSGKEFSWIQTDEGIISGGFERKSE
jgi:hypothetical protein